MNTFYTHADARDAAEVAASMALEAAGLCATTRLLERLRAARPAAVEAAFPAALLAAMSAAQRAPQGSDPELAAAYRHLAAERAALPAAVAAAGRVYAAVTAEAVQCCSA